MKIAPLPGTARRVSRLEGLEDSLSPFKKTLYRFINPAYSKPDDIVNGAGALHASGRWNLKGTFALSYTALQPETALAEALAHVRYFRLPPASALPRVLVSLHLEAVRILDLREGKVRQTIRLSQRTIRSLDWRAENRGGYQAETQAWGEAFAAAGLEAVVVPSAADPAGANVLVFPGNLLPGSSFGTDREVEWPDFK